MRVQQAYVFVLMHSGAGLNGFYEPAGFRAVFTVLRAFSEWGPK